MIDLRPTRILTNDIVYDLITEVISRSKVSTDARKLEVVRSWLIEDYDGAACEYDDLMLAMYGADWCTGVDINEVEYQSNVLMPQTNDLNKRL